MIVDLVHTKLKNIVLPKRKQKCIIEKENSIMIRIPSQLRGTCTVHSLPPINLG